MGTFSNPLFSAPQQAGINPLQPPPGQSMMPQAPQSPLQQTNPFAGAQLGNLTDNPYGQGTRGGGDQTFNLAQTNLNTGL